MDLSNELSCEAGCFSHHLNPTGFWLLISGLKLYFPELEPWVARSASQYTSCCLAGQLQLCPPRSTIHHPTPQSTTPLGPPATALLGVLSTWLPVSTPPTNLDECFFFISLVVGLPYSLIFCQFWLLFVFKLLLSFFWLWEEAQCVYLCLHLGQKFHYTHSYMDHQGHSRDMSCRLYT